MNDKSIIEKIAANAVETRYENFDDDTLVQAKYRIIDTLGCLIGGATDTGNPEMVELFHDTGGREEATILIHDVRVPVANAAFANSIMARSFDFEPVSPLVDGFSCPGHTSGTTVPTALTMAESANADGREMLTALIVGDDTTARILAASGFGFTLGWDGVGTVNAFGTAAIAGRLLGLSQRQMRHAFGIVLNMQGTTFQTIWDATTAFKLCQGLAARAGIFAAQLAKAGWTGPDDALFSKFGYYQMFTEGCERPEYLTDKLGKAYYADRTIKPYPCCRITHAAIDCALELMRKYNIKAEDIKEAELELAQGGIDHKCGEPFTIGDFPHANAAFSYHYTVATAFLYGCVKPEHFTEKAIRDSRIRDFIPRITFTRADDVRFEGARMNVTLNDGRKLTEWRDYARGDPVHNPMSPDEIIDKFWTNIDFSSKISQQKASELLETLLYLDILDSVRKLIPLMTA
ncbi:MAG TPA: MmgE/PrpD family protein [Dehalococcoidia bacterium]|nr:MmgE/PrpD family protein [Dehalococcoidia bacterium]